MNQQIGEDAGKLWSAIGVKGQLSLSNLPKINGSKESSYLALGWLAREDKVRFYNDKKGDDVLISLTENEEKNFKNQKNS